MFGMKGRSRETNHKIGEFFWCAFPLRWRIHYRRNHGRDADAPAFEGCEASCGLAYDRKTSGIDQMTQLVKSIRGTHLSRIVGRYGEYGRLPLYSVVRWKTEQWCKNVQEISRTFFNVVSNRTGGNDMHLPQPRRTPLCDAIASMVAKLNANSPSVFRRASKTVQASRALPSENPFCINPVTTVRIRAGRVPNRKGRLGQRS